MILLAISGTALHIGLIFLGLVIIGIGFYGCIGPIPGPPIALVAPLGLQLLNRTGHEYFNLGKLTWVILGVLIIMTIAIAVLDYYVPIWGTKKFGGTKSGVRGSAIGMILGFIIGIMTGVGLILVILGPFIGAYIGEKMAGTDDKLALKSAFGSFLGFLAGTAGKLVVTFFIFVVFVAGVIGAFA